MDDSTTTMVRRTIYRSTAQKLTDGMPAPRSLPPSARSSGAGPPRAQESQQPSRRHYRADTADNSANFHKEDNIWSMVWPTGPGSSGGEMSDKPLGMSLVN